MFSRVKSLLFFPQGIIKLIIETGEFAVFVGQPSVSSKDNDDVQDH